MPHSSRKKKSVTVKRREVTSEDGWTIVTKGITSRLQSISLTHLSEHGQAVPSRGSTVKKVTQEYQAIEAVWLASESCKTLMALIEDQVLTEGLQLHQCVLFGSGSFSGQVRQEVERRSVALCQLAVFKTLQRSVAKHTHQCPLMFAQEPAYNDVDRDFLGTQNVEVVSTPEGYDLLGDKSLVYTAYTDMDVEMQVISKRPGVFLSSRLDWYWRNDKGQACTSRKSFSDCDSPTSYVDRKDGDEERNPGRENAKQERRETECQAFEAFLQDRGRARIPDHNAEGEPFHNQYLYWQQTPEETATDQPQSSAT